LFTRIANIKPKRVNIKGRSLYRSVRDSCSKPQKCSGDLTKELIIKDEKKSFDKKPTIKLKTDKQIRTNNVKKFDSFITKTFTLAL